ncbi:DUF397 domain-containing protein [Streptomyces sp. NPDC002851]
MTGTLRWFKSSYSTSTGGDCVEVAQEHSELGAVHIRDSKHPELPHLTVPPGAWDTFLAWTR